MYDVLNSPSHVQNIESALDIDVARLEVADQGAYLKRFDELDGANLIYPAQLNIHGKLRGGVFVTLPQFGPDERDVEEPQEQHGYARNVLWRFKYGAPNTFAYEHTQTQGEYEGLGAFIRYSAEQSENGVYILRSYVELNNGSSNNMRVAPGLHPYFAVSEDDIDGYLEENPTGPNGVTTKANAHKVEFRSGHSIEVVSDYGFEFMTIWNGGDGKYLCIEPSTAGPSFKTNPDLPTEAEILHPGEVRQYAARFIIKK